MSDIPASQHSWWRQPPSGSADSLLIFLLVSAIDLALAKQFTDKGQAVISDALGGVSSGWWCCCLIALFLAIGPIGTLRLGGADAKPSLKFFDWCAVLIPPAGGGWCVLVCSRTALSLPDPITGVCRGRRHRGSGGSSPGGEFLHWGFLAWALVATTTTITFSILERRGEPLRPRTLLVNIVPRRWVDGPIGHLADGLSVVAAIAGTVGPLGFSLQLSNAAGQLPWLTDSAGLQSLVVVLLTAVFATSTVSGIQKGIKWLSELNVWLTLAMAAGLLLLGPGLWLIQHFFSGFITYLIHLPQMALTPNAVPANWVNSWTVFYWGWFLGYAPLMGLFTADVSAAAASVNWCWRWPSSAQS